MIKNDNSIPLWQQLQMCTKVMLQISLGKSLTSALENIAVDYRPGVQALAFACLRNWGKAQVLATILVAKKPSVVASTMLQIGLALLSNKQAKLYDEFTLVNQLVSAANKQYKTRGISGFLNACLRRYLRETAIIEQQINANLVAIWNHPSWWITKVQQDYPQQWAQILTADLEKPAMYLRVNLREVSVEQYAKLLEQQGISAKVINQQALCLDEPIKATQLPNFAKGWVSVQDISAQLAVSLLLEGDWLDNIAQPRILDACSAPGGKLCNLLEQVNAQVDAVEIDDCRAKKIVENLQRQHLQANLIVGDVNEINKWWDGKLYDAILLDAPCSGSGVVRKHPDGLWLKKFADIGKLVHLQQQMLQNLWYLLQPGGRLLYCVCSIFKDEGQYQVDDFLQRQFDAKLLPSVGNILPQLGQEKTKQQKAIKILGGDGFYYALLEKKVD